MDWKTLATVFSTVFVAELGDKTQLATMLYASRPEVSKATVMAGAAAALVCSTALGVLAGGALSAWIDARTLKIVAGLAFVAVGAWTLQDALR